MDCIIGLTTNKRKNRAQKNKHKVKLNVDSYFTKENPEQHLEVVAKLNLLKSTDFSDYIKRKLYSTT